MVLLRGKAPGKENRKDLGKIEGRAPLPVHYAPSSRWNVKQNFSLPRNPEKTAGRFFSLFRTSIL